MKGIVLAGGTGSRLHPLTTVTNKCLLPMYDRPMVYWPIKTLVDSNIKDILMVCGGNAAGEFLRILGNGEAFGLKHLHYTYQKDASGIADALSLAEEWANNEPVVVILADNVFEKNVSTSAHNFYQNPDGAKIFVYSVNNPASYGVVELDGDNVVSIEEKPKSPKSNYIATGLYMYDQSVWDLLRSLKPSQRNELEITDLNNLYLLKNKLKAEKLSGWWADAGESIDGYNDCCSKIREISQ